MTADTHDRLHRVVCFVAVIVSPSAVPKRRTVGPAVFLRARLPFAHSGALIEHETWGYSSAGRASEWHSGAAERCGQPLPDHDRVERHRQSYRLWLRDDNGSLSPSAEILSPRTLDGGIPSPVDAPGPVSGVRSDRDARAQASEPSEVRPARARDGWTNVDDTSGANQARSLLTTVQWLDAGLPTRVDWRGTRGCRREPLGGRSSIGYAVPR